MKKLINLRLNHVLLAVVLLLTAVMLSAYTADAQSPFMLATFAPCIGVIAGNITQDCDDPRIAGYENVALIFNRSDIDWSAVTYDSTNKRIVKSLAVNTGEKPYVIYNPRVNPAAFNGTNTTFDQETNRYTKTVQFYFEGIGGTDALNIVEPLKAGDYIVLLQRKDHRGNGSFQLMGFQSGLNSTAQVQDEVTGYWLITMECSEPSAEVAFFDTDFDTTKAAFDTLLGAA
jgi:hypothetical protein